MAEVIHVRLALDGPLSIRAGRRQEGRNARREGIGSSLRQIFEKMSGRLGLKKSRVLDVVDLWAGNIAEMHHSRWATLAQIVGVSPSGFVCRNIKRGPRRMRAVPSTTSYDLSRKIEERSRRSVVACCLV